MRWVTGWDDENTGARFLARYIKRGRWRIDPGGLGDRGFIAVQTTTNYTTSIVSYGLPYAGFSSLISGLVVVYTTGIYDSKGFRGRWILCKILPTHQYSLLFLVGTHFTSIKLELLLYTFFTHLLYFKKTLKYFQWFMEKTPICSYVIMYDSLDLKSYLVWSYMIISVGMWPCRKDFFRKNTYIELFMVINTDISTFDHAWSIIVWHVTEFLTL